MAALNLKAARADGRDLRVKPRPVPPAGRLRPAEPTAGVRHETRGAGSRPGTRMRSTVVCAAPQVGLCGGWSRFLLETLNS